jgi:uncharacterized phage protein (TIGR01671 family)
MRKILFRGKRVDNGEWVEGFLFNYNGAYCIQLEGIECDDYGLYPRCYAEVIPESVGQYTGLRDCKRTEEYPEGQMIFEGDIVVTNKFGSPEKKYVIVYDNKIATYIGEGKKRCCRYFTTFSGDADAFEIIGNIHDDSELLKGESNEAD